MTFEGHSVTFSGVYARKLRAYALKDVYRCIAAGEPRLTCSLPFVALELRQGPAVLKFHIFWRLVLLWLIYFGLGLFY